MQQWSLVQNQLFTCSTFTSFALYFAFNMFCTTVFTFSVVFTHYGSTAFFIEWSRWYEFHFAFVPGRGRWHCRFIEEE